MPIDVVDLDDGLGVIIKGEGVVTSKENYTEVMAHLSKPEAQLKKYLYTITDFTNVTKFEINLADIRKVALKSNQVAKLNSHVIVALSTSNPIYYGIARMWISFANRTGWTMQVFRNRADLDKWLRARIKEKFDVESLNFDST